MNISGPLHLSDDLFPLESYLNRAVGRHFLDMLRLTASGSSLSFDWTGWDTYREMDDIDRSYTPPFVGIRIYAGPGASDDVFVSVDTFVKHLRLAAEVHLKTHPADRSEVERLVDEIARELPARASLP